MLLKHEGLSLWSWLEQWTRDLRELLLSIVMFLVKAAHGVPVVAERTFDLDFNGRFIVLSQLAVRASYSQHLLAEGLQFDISHELARSRAGGLGDVCDF